MMNQLDWKKIKSGDKEAFRMFFDEYYSALCLYANSILKDLQLSQDIVSDCFIKIWERRGSIEIDSSVKNYLLYTVRNEIYSYLRSPESRKTDVNSVIDRIESIPIEEYDLENESKIQMVNQVIDELPDQRKRILKLAVFNGKSYKEIAEMLNISVNTVNTQMSRAYRFMRLKLTAEDIVLYFILKKIQKI